LRLPKFSLTLHLPANVSAARSSAWDSSRLCRGLAVLGWTTGTLAAIAVGSIGDLSAGGVLNCRHPYAASWSGAAKSQRSSLHTTPCTIQASCRLTLHRGPLDLIDHEHLPLFQPQPKLLRLPKKYESINGLPIPRDNIGTRTPLFNKITTWTEHLGHSRLRAFTDQ
jgi:hypothetical protein